MQKKTKRQIAIGISITGVLICLLFTNARQNQIQKPEVSGENATVTELVNSNKSEDLPKSSLIPASLLYVIDGDTLYVSDLTGENGRKIRLIGIDTPESVNENKELNTIYGAEASEYTKELLEGTDIVYLEYDQEEYDKYGRTLAYVWFSAETSDITNMLNLDLIKDGYAKTMEIEPNTKYASAFAEYEISAKERNVGLWAEGF